MIKLVSSAFYNEKESRDALVGFIQANKQLSFGPECQAFEKEFATWQGAKHAVMVSSGSTANFALIQALIQTGKLKKGDKVGFSAVTWPTNLLPIIQLGLVPVPIDVSLETINISPETLKKTLAKHKLKGLFMTHVLGLCDDMAAIVALCKKNKVLLFEDTCEALGTVYKGKKLGSFGIGGTFSFFIGHHMSTIEGGMVVTNDDDIARELKIIRSHGWDRHLDPADQKKLRTKYKVDDFYAFYTFYDLGNNFRPTEISGFLGRIQIQHADAIVKAREANFRKLAKEIYAREDLFYPLKTSHIDQVSNFAFPLVTKAPKIQKTIRERMKGIAEIRPLIAGNIARQPFYKKYVKGVEKLPNADLIHAQGMYFGNNPDLSAADIKTLVDLSTGFTV